ncbi:MAG: RnfABCDGE type electron transport complex subunit D [Myxococcota bacterium]|nr:RnfABCDGE type electron transport complex subunit D [Myxococcales bacterium]
MLATLLAAGVAWLDLDVRPANAAAILAAAQAAQLLVARARGERFDPRSALISSLSLCLLLRTGSATTAAAIAAVSVGSKAVLRVRGRHVFNPTAFGLVVGLVASDDVWVSPGQWGQAAWAAFAMASAGVAVVHRARRSDVTVAFLACYAGGLFARAAWLGDPLAIPLHALQTGALVLFAFFMISDPRTTPDARAGRIAFAAAVAAGALFVQYGLFRPNGLLLSLVACAPLVPLLDALVPAPRHAWRPGSPANLPGGIR